MSIDQRYTRGWFGTQATKPLVPAGDISTALSRYHKQEQAALQVKATPREEAAKSLIDTFVQASGFLDAPGTTALQKAMKEKLMSGNGFYINTSYGQHLLYFTDLLLKNELSVNDYKKLIERHCIDKIKANAVIAAPCLLILLSLLALAYLALLFYGKFDFSWVEGAGVGLTVTAICAGLAVIGCNMVAAIMAYQISGREDTMTDDRIDAVNLANEVATAKVNTAPDKKPSELDALLQKKSQVASPSSFMSGARMGIGQQQDKMNTNAPLLFSPQ